METSQDFEEPSQDVKDLIEKKNQSGIFVVYR